MVARSIAVLFVITASCTAGGCCLKKPALTALQKRTQREDAVRFRDAAHRLARQKGATPVDIKPRRTPHRLTFGLPTRARLPEGQEQIHIAVHKGLNPGVLIARRGVDRWLVLVADLRGTHYRVVRGCECRAHGGYYRQPAPLPAMVLPTADRTQVTVVRVRYHRRTVSVRRRRCPGPPVP